MLKVMIAECDPNTMVALKKELKEAHGIDDICEAREGQKLVQLIGEYKPDMLFLGVDAQIMNGFTVARKISELYPDIFLIIISATDCYARESLEVYAFDYLIKPFDLNRICQTIERIKKLRCGEGTSRQWSAAETTKHSKLAIQGTNKIDFINLSDIILITRSERKTVIHTTRGIMKSNELLQKLDVQLCHSIFFRCHKGYIINAEMVLEFAPWGNKTYVVKLANTNETALITSEKAKEFRARYCL